MIGQAGQRIARRLVAQLILERALPGDINGDDLMARKISMVVMDAAAA